MQPDIFDAFRRAIEARQALPPIERVPRDRHRALSYSQERLWFLEQLRPARGAYNLPSAFRLRGPLDRSALAAAFGDVIGRHESLRTCFPSTGGVPAQVVLPPAAFDLPVDDLRSTAAADPEEAARRWIDAQAWKPFDLERGPLFRARLLDLGAGDHILFMNVHHIVYDGWSESVLFNDLASCYHARREGRVAGLEALPVQYLDFAAWQRALLDGPARKKLLAYWNDRLSGVLSPPNLPAMRQGPSSGRSERLPVPFAEELADALARLAASEGVTLFAVLFAAFTAVLHEAAGQRDLFVCTPVASRTRPELEAQIGYFVNLLILRSEWAPGARTFREHVRGTALGVEGALAHQALPVQWLSHLDLGGASVSRVLFALHNLPDDRLNLAGLDVRRLAIDGGPADFAIYLSIEQRGGRLTASIKYDPAAIDASAVEDLAARFAGLLTRAAESSAVRIDGPPAQSAGDRIVREHAAQVVPAAAGRSDLVAELRRLSPAEGVARLGADLLSRIRRLQPAHTQPVEPGQSLADLGLDSLRLIDLANQIRTALGVEIAVAAFLEPISIAALARELYAAVARAHVLQSRAPIGEPDRTAAILRF